MQFLDVNMMSVQYDRSDNIFALEDVSFSVQKGERVALIGANGAGKSTLLLAMIGILPMASGQLTLEGVKLEKKSLGMLRRQIGVIFQNPDDQIFMPSVYEDIAFGPRNNGVSEKTIDADMDKLLNELGVSHLKERLSHKLSGGEKRLVALANVLIMKPELILMDEPSSFLDPRSRRRLIQILETLSKTMIIATHDLDMALDVCDRVILLKEGRIYRDADADQVLQDGELLEECGL